MTFPRKLLPASIIAAMALILLAATAARAQPQDAARTSSSKPAVRVTISEETTWITAPLREDGYPDYVRYLNEKLSEGVRPENNAMVPLVRAVGPLDLDAPDFSAYYKRLGIAPPPKDGDYFEPWPTYTSRTPEAEQPRVPPGDKRLQKDYFEELVEEAAARLWTRKEFPHVAKWLAKNKQHIDSFVDASKLPRLYSPLIIIPDEHFEHLILLNAWLLDVDVIRDATQSLHCRAMLRASDNELRGAQDDLLAAQRLAVLLSSTPTLSNFLAAKDIEYKTRSAAIQLCAQTPLSRKQTNDFRGQWTRFPAIATMAKAIDIGERLQFLDATCYVAEDGWGALLDIVGLITDLSGDGEPKPRDKRDFRIEVGAAVLSWLVRWDEPLKLGHEWYDRLLRITRIDDVRLQMDALDEFDNYLQKIQAEKILLTRTGLYFYPRTLPTKFTSRALIGVFMPAVHATFSAAHHVETYRSMFDVSMALFEYRADLKDCPDNLERLVPEYIESIPVDDFGRRELVYRKTDAGFLLYSLGQNGRDNGGKERNEDEDADDIVIRVPIEKSRVAIKQ
jgi:hypothetical protein